MRVINNVYAVFFDTNTIKGKYWLDHSIKQSASSLGLESMIPTELYVPEVVQQEWTRYYIRHAKEQFERIVDASSKLTEMSFDGPSEYSFDENKARENAQNVLREIGFSVVPTPHTKINYPQLLELAIEHLPPFEPSDGTDKGIKDAIIAQTIKNFSDSNPNKKVVFIGRDGLMTAYLRSIISEDNSLSVYGTLEEFIEELKLQNNDLSKELAKGASEAFFIQDVKTSFYYQLNVRDILLGRYRSKLVDAEKARQHLKMVKTSATSLPFSKVAQGQWILDTNTVYVSDPSFLRKENNRLVWSVELSFVQNYNVEVVQDEPDVPTAKYLVKHTVFYILEWSAELAPDGELINPSLGGIKDDADIQTVLGPQNGSALSRLLNLEYLSSPVLSSVADAINTSNKLSNMLPDLTTLGSSIAPMKITGPLANIDLPNPIFQSPGANLRKASATRSNENKKPKLTEN